MLAKILLSPPKNENIEKHELLRMNLTFLKYLQSIMIKQKEMNVLSVLNAIILRMSQLDYCRNSSINVINEFEFDLLKWVPDLILNEIWLRKEKLCLMVESEKDVGTNNEYLSNFSIDYQHRPIMIWYSRSKNKDNAEVIAKPSQELLDISKNRFALGFEN